MLEPTALITEAIGALQSDLDRRIVDVSEQLKAHDKLMVELQLSIDDVAGDKHRAELLALLACFDSAHDDLTRSLGGLVSYDLFDPLRVLVADLREDARERQPA